MPPMTRNSWLALLCLAAGVPLAAWGLAHGVLLAGFVGLVLVLLFWALAWHGFAGLGRPSKPIVAAERSAWKEFAAGTAEADAKRDQPDRRT